MIRRKDRGLAGNGGKFASPRSAESESTLGPARQTREDRINKTLADFIEFAEMGERLIARGREAYNRDEALRLASESIISRLGEAVSRLDDQFRAEYPEISWRQMKAMRNLVVHDYGSVSHIATWDALERHLPIEAEKVRRILQERAAR